MSEKAIEKGSAVTLGLLSFGLLISILFYSREAYQAALNGLELWLRVVFPALLPFFIASEVMNGLGVVDFLSILLTPVMGPLFKCPGSSSFIWTMSVTSGYPVGARLVSLFRQQRKITVEEGQRILSFCSTSGPLFMMGAVAIGMLGSIEGGRIILFSHYAAAIILGLLFRRYHTSGYRIRNQQSVSLSLAVSAMVQSRKRDGRTLGALLGDAVRNSVNILLLIGGFIILFSVIIDILMRLHIISAIVTLLSYFLQPLGFSHELLSGVTSGLFEVTVGSRIISDTAITLQQKIAAVSFLIGWSGFSIHAQIASILNGSGIRLSVYLLTKLVHGLLAAIISWPVTIFFFPKALEVFHSDILSTALGWKPLFMQSLLLCINALVFLFLLSIAFTILIKLRPKEKAAK